jgi:hypothetical protein
LYSVTAESPEIVMFTAVVCAGYATEKPATTTWLGLVTLTPLGKAAQ